MMIVSVLIYEIANRENFKLCMEQVQKEDATLEKAQEAVERNYPGFAIAKFFKKAIGK